MLVEKNESHIESMIPDRTRYQLPSRRCLVAVEIKYAATMSIFFRKPRLSRFAGSHAERPSIHAEPNGCHPMRNERNAMHRTSQP